MRITDISAVIYRQRIAHRDVVQQRARPARAAHDTVLVRVKTDRGLVGWGEAFGHFGVAATTLTALDTLVAPLARGESPFADEATTITLTDRLARRLHPLGASGPVAYALGGLDIALWDLLGKARRQPLHELLGGATATTMPAYASMMRYVDPVAVAAETQEAIRRGYAGVKLHEIDFEPIVAAARATAATATPLMLDVNCAWSLAEAADRMAAVTKAMAGRLPHWLEEPVWPPDDYAAMATLRQQTGIAVAAGENAASPGDFETMLRLGAVSHAQPSVTKIGGLSNALRLCTAARAAGCAVAPHSPYFGPGLLATLHLCAARAPAAWIEHLLYDLEPGPFGTWVKPRDGRFSLPSEPGLGVDPDPARLAACRLVTA